MPYHYIGLSLFCRKYVVYKFPHLKFLDSKPVTAKEKKEAKRTGKYLRSNEVLNYSPD